MPRPRQATTGNAARAEMLRDAWQMKIDGHTEQAIADKYGVNQSTVSRWLKQVFAERTEPVAAELRAIEVDKLDQAERAVMEVLRTRHVTVSHGRVIRVTDPATGEEIDLLDDAPVLQAVDRLLRISARRATLLGLDGPQRYEVVTLDAIDAEIQRLTAELGGTQTGETAPTPTTP